ncbi:MAG: MaoC family dehydratase [Rhodospirillales bacterium]
MPDTPADTPLGAPHDLHGCYFEDLEVGMSASRVRVVTDGDIQAFADVSGDVNPVHLDDGFAASTMFKSRIAHGMLAAGYISAVLGMDLPGPGAIYVSQNLKFKAPVRAGDEVTATATVSALAPEKRFAVMETVCTVGGKPVLTGEATVMVTPRPAA